MIEIIERPWGELVGFWEKHNAFKGGDTQKPNKIDASNGSVMCQAIDIRSKPETNFGVYLSESGLIACGSLFIKQAPALTVGGIGRIAVDSEYRLNGIATALLEHMIFNSYAKGCHVAVLWASVLKVYEKVGFTAIYKNMMYRPILGLPTTYNVDRLKELPIYIGTF